MKVREVTAVIEEFAPLSLQESYDNSGLIVGRLDDEVNKALLAVDKDMWMEDVKDQEEYFAQFGDRLPKAISKQLDILADNLSK